MPPAADAAIGEITEITLERDCFGCASGSLLQLRHDGQAVLTMTGKARHRTSDQVALGRVAATDFDRLARQLVDAGYFALNEVYDSSELADGAWSTVRVLRQGRWHEVFMREGHGPAALRQWAVAAGALQARIDFVAQPAGAKP